MFSIAFSFLFDCFFEASSEMLSSSNITVISITSLTPSLNHPVGEIAGQGENIPPIRRTPPGLVPGRGRPCDGVPLPSAASIITDPNDRPLISRLRRGKILESGLTLNGCSLTTGPLSWISAKREVWSLGYGRSSTAMVRPKPVLG